MNNTRRSTRTRRALLVPALAVPMLAAAPLASAALLDTPTAGDTHRYLCLHVDLEPPVGLCLTNNR